MDYPVWNQVCACKVGLGAKVANRRLGGSKLVENPLDQKEDDGAGSHHKIEDI